MAKYRRKAESDIRSFRRTLATREELGSAILVVTEGENTEPIYFDEIRKQFAAPTVEMVAYGAGRGDPRALADEALRLREERRTKMSSKNLKLGISRLEDYDQMWIVFDTDVLETQKLNDGIAYAKSNGIHIASSEPCFEFWLLLHKKYTSATMLKCANVIPYLDKFLGWENYSGQGKEKKIVEKLMKNIVEKQALREAVSNALKIRKLHEDAETKYPANPSTDVDLLILAINHAVSPANKFL